MNDKIEITLDEYHKLKRDSIKLAFLDGGGVDNWDGYDWSLEGLADALLAEGIE